MKWYYLDNGAQRGPITEAEFPALFQTGVLRPETYLWREGMADWKPYSELLSSPSPTGSEAPATSNPVPGAPVVGRAVAATAGDPAATCSQCGAETSPAQLMRIGSAALCPKCQVGYKRQAEVGFGDGPIAYAHPLARFAASILDNILCFAVVGALFAGAPLAWRRFLPDRSPNEALGIAALLSLLWVLDYFVGRIVRDGATPFMKLFRIRVATPDGGRVRFFRALGRFMVLWLTGGVGSLLVFFDKQRRSLPDLVCKTIVIKK